MLTPYTPDPNSTCPPGDNTDECVLCGGTYDTSDLAGDGYRSPLVCHQCLSRAVEDLTKS